jgi:hypothetical protein
VTAGWIETLLAVPALDAVMACAPLRVCQQQSQSHRPRQYA